MRDCPDCEEWRSKGARFCGSCGQRFEENASRPSVGLRDVLWLLVYAGILLGLVVFVCNYVYLAINFAHLSEIVADVKVSFTVYFGLWHWRLFYYSGVWILVELLVCIIVETASLAYAMSRLWKIHKDSPTDYDAHLTSGMGASIAVMSITVFISILSTLITLIVAGTVPDTSWMDDYDRVFLQYDLTCAGVIEEFQFRILYIGLPMVAIGYAFRKGAKSWQYILGGFGMNKAALIFLIISSVLFGLAHYDGWGWSKIPMAAIAGFAYGYLYCEYGLYAPILAHTVTDTMIAVTYMLGLGGLVTLAYIGLGLVMLIWVIAHPRKDMLDFKNLDSLPPSIEGSFLQNWKRH